MTDEQCEKFIDRLDLIQFKECLKRIGAILEKKESKRIKPILRIEDEDISLLENEESA